MIKVITKTNVNNENLLFKFVYPNTGEISLQKQCLTCLALSHAFVAVRSQISHAYSHLLAHRVLFILLDCAESRTTTMATYASNSAYSPKVLRPSSRRSHTAAQTF